MNYAKKTGTIWSSVFFMVFFPGWYEVVVFFFFLQSQCHSWVVVWRRGPSSSTRAITPVSCLLEFGKEKIHETAPGGGRGVEVDTLFAPF